MKCRNRIHRLAIRSRLWTIIDSGHSVGRQTSCFSLAFPVPCSCYSLSES